MHLGAGTQIDSLHIPAHAQTKQNWVVVVESCLAPIVTWSATGQTWNPAEVKSLAAQRLSQLYRNAASDWLVQTGYLPGDNQALAFGIDQSSRTRIQAVAVAQNASVSSIVPMWVWCQQDLAFQQAVHASHGSVIWLLLEQDRCLVSVLSATNVQIVNQTANLPTSWSELVTLVHSCDESSLPVVVSAKELPSWILPAHQGVWSKQLGLDVFSLWHGPHLNETGVATP